MFGDYGDYCGDPLPPSSSSTSKLSATSPSSSGSVHAVTLLGGPWLLIIGLITLLIIPLNGLIGVTPIISRVISPVISIY